ncbi:hypothetical protein KDA_37810 [Dictyobacter alpinus]|uniref:Uncharacterized protein n=1 Tax=Dictyobacter alpinus TaxID=2014873 RepID=A0A402BAH9_9CHLR|nr:hypothetical protein [Dictyobacter alpinus]GCE28297.1 hypothetical protein KDA_37810 [Dictyobacter alpinus]
MPHNRGYLLGRLFVLLAQQEVLQEQPEHSYRLASTVPPQILPAALALAIERGREEQLYPLTQLLPIDAFNGPLNRREQGAFALGYLHERSGFPMPVVEDEDDEPDLTERYELRIDPSLKEWIKLHGGGPFIRALLRAERLKQFQEKTTELAQEASPKEASQPYEQ